MAPPALSGTFDPSLSPVAVGGVGGSGTRVVAGFLSELGLHIGADLNDALDNLWFTLLFKYREVLAHDSKLTASLYAAFRSRMSGTPGSESIIASYRDMLLSADREGQHPADWLVPRIESFSAPASRDPEQAWGWKEPNTHMLIDRLFMLEPTLRYIHVWRDAAYMVHSRNQNQLRLWGPSVLAERFEISPRGSLAFWVKSHRRAQTLAAEFPTRVLMLSHDALCRDPTTQLRRLLAFLSIEPASVLLERLAAQVERRRDTGKQVLTREDFDQKDIDFVASLQAD